MAAVASPCLQAARALRSAVLVALATSALVALAPGVACAQAVAQADPPPVAPGDDPVRTLDRISVSATTLPTTAAAASQHVTVIGRDALDAMAGMSVGDVLATQAGLVTDRGARSGGYGALYMRGADPSHVVVLIDGVRQNDPLSSRGSAVDLNTLTTGDVERIEIVRGNASVLNAEAMAGVIHIFTRRGGDGASAGIDAGGDGLAGVRANVRGAGWRAGATAREDGDRDTGYGRTRAADAGWSHAFGERVDLQVDARVADSRNLGFPDDSGGERYADLRTLEERRATSRQGALQLRVAGEGGSALQFQATALSRSSDERSPGVAPGLRDPAGLPAIDSLGEYRRQDAQLLWLSADDAALRFTVGAQYQREHGTLDSLIRFGPFFALPADFDLRRRTVSLLAEARWQVGAWTWQGGVRREDPDRADASVLPMLSLQRTLGAGRGQWGASVGRSVKQPSFYALGHPLVGNPALKAEHALQRELYYATDADAAWPLRLTLFSARYRDLVDFDAGPPPQLVNRARVAADGIEWSLSHRFANDWRLRFDGSRQRVRADDGVTLRFRPQLQWNAGLDLPLPRAFALSLQANHLGRRFDSSIPTGDRWLPAVTTLDAALRRRFGAVAVVAGIDNVFDTAREQAIGTPWPGRRLRLSLTWATR